MSQPGKSHANMIFICQTQSTLQNINSYLRTKDTIIFCIQIILHGEFFLLINDYWEDLNISE